MRKKILPQELLKRAQAGDERVYEQLILAYTPDLYQAVRRMLQDNSQIELILQETFWRAWQALDGCDGEDVILPYLTGIAEHLVRERWRKNGRMVEEVERKYSQ